MNILYSVRFLLTHPVTQFYFVFTLNEWLSTIIDWLSKCQVHRHVPKIHMRRQRRHLRVKLSTTARPNAPNGNIARPAPQPNLLHMESHLCLCYAVMMLPFVTSRKPTHTQAPISRSRGSGVIYLSVMEIAWRDFTCCLRIDGGGVERDSRVVFKPWQ